METEHTENTNFIVDVKDTIKITKNTKGYNYEFRLIAREGVDLLEQVNFVRSQLEEQIKSWEAEDNDK